MKYFTPQNGRITFLLHLCGGEGVGERSEHRVVGRPNSQLSAQASDQIASLDVLGCDDQPLDAVELLVL